MNVISEVYFSVYDIVLKIVPGGDISFGSIL